MAISHSLPVLKKNKVAISNDYLLERLVGKKASFFNVPYTEKRSKHCLENPHE